jgi:soluble lytic murein transglycosylase
MARAGNESEARRYFELAAAYPDHFYGMLAAERLARPVPGFHGMPNKTPSSSARAAFYAKPLTQAVREVARGADWQTGVRFYREIADQAESEEDHLLVADLARTTGRRDLGVILGQAAHTDGLDTFQEISFPLSPTPPGANWTWVHAIARQESQFAQNAISHAGARGLMQLMPATGREQAGKMGLSYDVGRLISDPVFNIQLGDGYFARLMNIYGSYPLAVAAYNAGGGNVNKWLRANGDPRSGSVDWIDWLEKIPLSETRNYVQRVLENAVVYEAMNPARASYRGPNPLSRFIGKNRPG